MRLLRLKGGLITSLLGVLRLKGGLITSLLRLLRLKGGLIASLLGVLRLKGGDDELRTAISDGSHPKPLRAPDIDKEHKGLLRDPVPTLDKDKALTILFQHLTSSSS